MIFIAKTNNGKARDLNADAMIWQFADVKTDCHLIPNSSRFLDFIAIKAWILIGFR